MTGQQRVGQEAQPLVCARDTRRGLRRADLSLGLVNASVVTFAESLGIRRLATRGMYHFAAVRLR
jgi:hypothetical protein